MGLARRIARGARALLATAATLAAGAVVHAAPAGAPVKPAQAAAARPNVVVILMDDVGFSDISSYGGEIPTPNIDALAANGLRFTQFYNTARCSPSRASLLTGTYPHQAGMGGLEEIAVPGSQGLHGRLLDRVVTMGEAMQSAGYFTAMAGKWHLGMSRGVNPWERGFDRSLTSPKGALYFPDQREQGAKTLYLNGERLPVASPRIGNGHWYSSDLFVDWGETFIDEARAQRKPFFLYLPFVGAHFPIMAPPEDVSRFRGKYMQGWDTLRAARLERQKRLGIVAPGEALPPRLPNTYDWDKLSPEDRDRFDAIMATYAASIARIDKAVGDLVAGLKARGEFDNTLILFLSDNGGNGESGPDGRLIGGPPGSSTSVVWAGMNWATLQNTPFQYFKHHTEEGGIATPLIAHWPKGIDARLDGSLVRTPTHLIDIMPTVLQASGGRYPRQYKGHDIVPMQGVSLMPSFRGKAIARATPIFWEHEGNKAVRDGKWKLVGRFERPWQLYDMHESRAEMHDLAARHPDVVRRMAEQWNRWAASSYVDPWSEAYDIWIRENPPRQNWGASETPQRPDAMNAMTDTLARTLKARSDAKPLPDVPVVPD